ncbi:hypothetical protein Droror1_Dr00010524, partial [Drosera rotundifolia]
GTVIQTSSPPPPSSSPSSFNRIAGDGDRSVPRLRFAIDVSSDVTKSTIAKLICFREVPCCISD